MNYSISISLQVWHPHFTGDQLGALFNRASDVKHTVGENIVRGDGKRLPSKYVDSYVCYDIVPLQNFTDLYEPLKEANGIVLNMLKEKKSFFELKKEKGRVVYYCAIYTKEHVAFSIPSEISKELSDLGIDVGIEVFQEYTE